MVHSQFIRQTDLLVPTTNDFVDINFNTLLQCMQVSKKRQSTPHYQPPSFILVLDRDMFLSLSSGEAIREISRE